MIKSRLYIKGSVLPTVLVLCSLISLVVLGIINVSGNFSSLRYRIFYQKIQRSYIESGFVLYNNIQDFTSQISKDSSYILFKDREQSKIYLETSLWGLFGLVSVFNHDRTLSKTGLTGYRKNNDDPCLYYADNNSPLYVAGETILSGKLKLPAFGLKYTQLQSNFFSGKEVEPSMIERSEHSLPEQDSNIVKNVSNLFGQFSNSYDLSDLSDSTINHFQDNMPIVVSTQRRVLSNIFLKGKIILLAKDIKIEKSSLLEDIIIVADKIVVDEQFKGVVQLFARDTVILKKGVLLDYPSGIFLNNKNKKRHLSIDEGCSVKGYVIIEGNGETDIKYLNYKQHPSATVHGFLYVDGVAQIQGSVCGNSYVKQVVYYSNEGYYDNTVYNAKFSNTDSIVSPIWLTCGTNRTKQQMKWVR